MEFEKIYKMAINENFGWEGDDNDYPPSVLRAARQLGRSPAEVWAKGGDDPESWDEEERASHFKKRERPEGDIFISKKNNNKVFVMVKDEQGNIVPKPLYFTGKDGRKWKRAKRKDGSWGVTPVKE